MIAKCIQGPDGGFYSEDETRAARPSPGYYGCWSLFLKGCEGDPNKVRRVGVAVDAYSALKWLAGRPLAEIDHFQVTSHKEKGGILLAKGPLPQEA